MFGNKPHPSSTTPPSPSGKSPDSSEAEQVPAVVRSTEVEKKDPAQDLVGAKRAHSFSALKQKVESGIESYIDVKLETDTFKRTKAKLLEQLVEQVDFISLNQLGEDVQRKRVFEFCDKILADIPVPLNADQVSTIKNQALDELFGFGPLEPLLADPDIADIMINGPYKVYIEKHGKVKLTDVHFMDDSHLLTIVQRIVSRVGRRVDEASPMVDARMPDGSRFNAIIPPLALDGCLVSIRKFKKNKMPLSQYVEMGSISRDMAKFLEICSSIGLNIIVSGGTGSGKTTLLNALSGCIEDTDRIVTIEDAAELQLQQPHVLRLETRPASVEGRGEVNQRALVKNALRMRPDRIILGEMRGDEVIDVLSAMNTGHDGSMATIHANNPRDCLSRLENLVGMSDVKIDINSLRRQVVSAIQLIVQIERMRDGSRKIVAIEEIVGLEGDIYTTQTLFSFRSKGLTSEATLDGEFISHGIRPKMLGRAEYYGRDKELLECLNIAM